MIKDYFRNYLWNTCDTTLRLGRDAGEEFHNRHDEEDWTVTLADTGESSMTAYRIKQIERYIGSDNDFLLTYGDGVGDVDITASITTHKKSAKTCTLTAVRPPGRFGELALAGDSTIKSFNEKPQTEGGYINGGYMVCNRSIFDTLPNDPNVMLEQAPLKGLAANDQLGAYCHKWLLAADGYLPRVTRYLTPCGHAGKAPTGKYGRHVTIQVPHARVNLNHMVRGYRPTGGVSGDRDSEGSITNKLKLMLALVAVGYLGACFYCYLQGVYWGKPYPYNTFPHQPPWDRFMDYHNMILMCRNLNPYREGTRSGYPPFANIFFFPFTRLSTDTGFLIFVLVPIATALVGATALAHAGSGIPLFFKVLQCLCFCCFCLAIRFFFCD